MPKYDIMVNKKIGEIEAENLTEAEEQLKRFYEDYENETDANIQLGDLELVPEAQEVWIHPCSPPPNPYAGNCGECTADPCPKKDMK